MEEINIIPFELCHISQMAEIEKECFSTPFGKEDFEKLYESGISNALVVLTGDRVIGHVSFTVIIDECQIINVCVSSRYRKMGVGSRLMDAFLEHLRKRDVKKIFLEVRESNSPAINLYKKYGFFSVGVSKNHFSLPTENAILMNFEF